MVVPEIWVPVEQMQFVGGKRVIQIIRCFLVFNGPNHSGVGAGAKKFRCLELEIGVPVPQPWMKAPKKRCCVLNVRF